MYLSKETFEKWRRGEVRMKGNEYPVCDLTDEDFTATRKKPDTVFGPQSDKYPENECLCEDLDRMDDPTVKADLLYVIRKYFMGKKFNRINFEKWDGSYIAMLKIFMRHHGECVSKKNANKRYVDPEEWGLPHDEALAAFRKALHEIEEWKEFNDEKFSEFRKTVNDLKNKEEITEEDLSELEDLLLLRMTEYRTKDERFEAFMEAFTDLYDDDCVYQNPHMDVSYSGDKVRIHIWGRDDG
jgi:hypothetical protein